MPPGLSTAIGGEKQDFVVKAGRIKPKKKIIPMIIFSIVWLAFSSVFVFGFFGPLFQGEEVHFTMNDVPTVASMDNLQPLLGPAIIIGIFILVGIGILAAGLYFLFAEGSWYVGTPKRLIKYKKGNIRSIDWEQFSGDIEVSRRAEQGDISLKMRTGKMVSQKNGPKRFVPDVIYIAGISNVMHIEQICRKRIKENDPTPTRGEI